MKTYYKVKFKNGTDYGDHLFYYVYENGKLISRHILMYNKSIEKRETSEHDCIYTLESNLLKKNKNKNMYIPCPIQMTEDQYVEELFINSI